MNKNTLIIAGVIAFVLVGGTGYYLFTNSNVEISAPTAEGTNVESNVNFDDLTNLRDNSQLVESEPPVVDVVSSQEGIIEKSIVPDKDTDEVSSADDNVPPIKTVTRKSTITPDDRVYNPANLKNFAELYWAISKFSVDDDEAVDNYLLINECDLYRDYFQNEFEWGNIRERARDELTKKKDTFNTRFEYIQPLKFANYNMDTKQFYIWEPYKIFGARSFEILAEDLYDTVCGITYRESIARYQKGLYVELNRPFTVDKIPVRPEMAESYIRMHNERMRDAGLRAKDREALYSSRDAYLVMKIRVFAYKDDVQTKENKLAKVLAVLESYQIYGDRDRTMLLFERDYNRKNLETTSEVDMKLQFRDQLKLKLDAQAELAAE